MSSADAHLAIFLKQPCPGKVKTRLAVDIGESPAAALYRAFATDTLLLAARCQPRSLRLVYDGQPPSRWLPQGLDLQLGRFSEHEQCEGDLGARLEHAMLEAGRQEAMPLLFLGSDSPDLPLKLVNDALARLASADLVLGASDDGGVWCIGLRKAFRGFFEEIPWSSPTTGDALRNRAGALGLNREEVEAWHDVDHAHELPSLRERLENGSGPATWTRRWISQHPRWCG